MTTGRNHPSPELLELRSKLRSGFDALRDSVPEKFHGAAVLEILRTMDQAELLIATGEQAHLWVERVRYGTVRALALFLPGAIRAQEPPSGQVNLQLASWGFPALVQSGTLSLASLFADFAATGLTILRKTGNDEYSMRAVHPDSGVEALEREDLGWWRDRIATLQADEEEQLLRSEPYMRRQLALAILGSGDDNGGPAEAEMDDYFESLAVLHTERMLGYDYFTNSARFGGIDFLTYELAVVLLVRWALYESRRIQVQLDLLSVPLDTLAARELLVQVLPRQEIVDFFCSTLDIDDASASQITTMFTLDEDFAASDYPGIPSSANPPFVALGGDHLAVSLHGCLNAPFQFLLARLRPTFPNDWRSAANQHEGVFREQLYTLFGEERFLCVPREIKLRVDGRELTDIDAFVLDRETGVAGLFQLKWWLTFGASMRERASVARNMESESAKWIGRVQGWLEGHGLTTLAHQASLRRVDRNRLRSVRLFLLGRNFVHFSGQPPPDDGVARGNWHQVLRLTAEGLPGESRIEALWEALRLDSPHLRLQQATGRTVVDSGDFRVILDGVPGGKLGSGYLTR